MSRAIQNERLKQYLEAEKAVLAGQSYTIGNRQLTRASLGIIRQVIDELLVSGATLDDNPEPMRGRAKRVLFMD